MACASRPAKLLTDESSLTALSNKVSLQAPVNMDVSRSECPDIFDAVAGAARLEDP